MDFGFRADWAMFDKWERRVVYIAAGGAVFCVAMVIYALLS